MNHLKLRENGCMRLCPSISEETNTAHKISSTVITLEKLFFWSTGKTEKQIGR